MIRRLFSVQKIFVRYVIRLKSNSFRSVFATFLGNYAAECEYAVTSLKCHIPHCTILFPSYVFYICFVLN